MSFKEHSDPGSTYIAFHPTLLRLTLRGVKQLAQGHIAPPILVHVQWGYVAFGAHVGLLLELSMDV